MCVRASVRMHTGRGLRVTNSYNTTITETSSSLSSIMAGQGCGFAEPGNSRPWYGNILGLCLSVYFHASIYLLFIHSRMLTFEFFTVPCATG
jgi:hypothetical protein